MKKLLIGLILLLPVLALAAEEVELPSAPIDPKDAMSLQRGARLFVNYCLNCHSAEYMRYNRLSDIGLTEDQIKESLLFATDKVGSTMTVAMTPQDGKVWFGAPPPDLTVIARSRGPDWLYAYLRSFYRDPTTPTGWNNVVYPNVAMPHVLWQRQGQQVLQVEEKTDAQGHKVQDKKLVLDKKGTMTPIEYDQAAADLVNYLFYMGEPTRAKRIQLGIVTLLLLGVLFVFAYWLKKEYWKDVH